MKQVILVRADLKMPKGKLSSQVAHASVEAVLKSPDYKVSEWRTEGMKKVILKVKDEKELTQYKKLADKERLTNALIKDAGLTEFKEPTLTCLAIGPDNEESIDKITKKLKLI
ncbi:MAG: peptidyl-tRNA hydrolase Pth2 [Candidatus Nanoarchaeia archaeon]|nr:peptidyl-tRNA hydrolase Pth2 [Candidatus Nanoarchaeia archaeon]MDD5588194.1 peptidyl-tRNA hydrolase Pth2 [Candidatus Nanoarchaeia archaeon]